MHVSPPQTRALPRPSSYTTEKAGGGVKWVGWPPTRPPCASLPHRRFEVLQRPFSRSLRGRRESSSHCVVRLGTACPRCEPTSRASYSIIFFGVVQSGIHESVPTAILAAFSHNPSFSVHGVVPATRLSLDTRSHNKSPLNRNSSKYVQHRMRALGLTRLEACSSTISLAIHPARAHHVRISSSEALKNQEGVSSHARPPLVTPPSRQESRASSDAPDAFSAPSMPASLERSIRPCAIRYRRALPFLPCPRARHHAGTNTDPTALPATRAARDAGVPRRPRRLVAFPHTVTLQQCTAVAACACRTPQHHFHHLLRARWSFPTAGAAFIASSHAKCVSSKYHYPRSTRAQGACMHDLSRAQHLQQPLPIARAPVLLSGTGSTTRSIAGARNNCNERFLSPAPPSSPLRAPRPSSAPTPPSAPNLGLPRIANATCTTPGVSLCSRPHHPVNRPAFHVHPQRHSAPLVADSATPPPMRSTPRGGFPSPAPAAFAAMAWLRASSGRMTRRRCAPRAKDF
ncbi:hypothetical protein B0H14DRAFT_3883504 [Mycena olivaceomarginata]|nr:hypothetical protein B0H14DRAFT_3883504 [Mycena olivaceomarginata]